MFGYEKIKLTLFFDWGYFLLALIILIAYTVYVYRYTLPPIPKAKRFLLIGLRSIALLFLLLIFFEPVLTLTEKNILSPVNLFFFDNSRSMKIDDKTNRLETLKKIKDETLTSNLSNNSEFYSFGSSVNEIPEDSLNQTIYNDAVTDVASIFNKVKQTEKNISSITIVSDGVVTRGSTPIYTAEKFGIPVFTVGIGDSAQKNDVEIKNVLYNEIIYAQTPTSILTTVINQGYTQRTATVSLYDGNSQLEQKNIILDKSGTNSVEFVYTPKTSGEKKLRVTITDFENEATTLNNQKVFYVNILDNKINILLVAGNPSADLTFIKHSLEQDDNLRVNTLTEISENTFLENNSQAKVDSAAIIYFIGYPTTSSSDDFFRKLLQKINAKNTPLFFLITGNTSIQKISTLNDYLPITIRAIQENYIEVQPDIETVEIRNPLVESNTPTEWNNLPPIYQPIGNFILKPESKVISKVKINGVPRNNPLLITRNFGSNRSISIIGKEIWRWKLQMSQKSHNLFDNFILNSARWLNTPDGNKKVRITTSKKNYSTGEDIEFSGQVYDESFNPVSDAEVKVKITSQSQSFDLNLNSIGNGLYEGNISVSTLGDYSYTGIATIDSKRLGIAKGKFNIGDVDVEMQNTRMNYEFLNQLSSITKGKYFSPQNYARLLTELKKINLNSSKEKIINSEIRLWSSEWMLIIVVLLLSLEWLIRKRNGML